jgi:cellulose synthase/poly-beta-1,6-N-acetylglucosamine synthase-like glycosyltransferase
MKNRVTIFVAVKNKNEIIEKCIDSLLQIDWPDKEILVVDNMSTDGSYEKLLKFKGKITLHRIKGGVSEVFNWALAKSEDEYFVCTDADCIVDPKWVKELIAPFALDPQIVATAGFCGTPKNVNFLQKLIGLELENRYNHFREYIERAPTMNLCLKTEVAKKVGFDAKFTYQSFEVDFCYRMSKYGKIKYVPSAKVWHFHRSNLFSYIKQQKDQAKWGWKLFLKHGKRSMADQITTFSMSSQIFLLGAGIITMLLANWIKYFGVISIFLLLLLLIIYIKDLIEIRPQVIYLPAFMALFLIRTLCWELGIMEGVFSFLRKTI